MRLNPRSKDRYMLDDLIEISNASFTGIERPPYETFKAHFNEDEVFVDSDLQPRAFAIVTERGGPYIWSIAVHPEYRMNHRGSTLLSEVLGHYRSQAETISLTCKVDNVAAQVLYLKNGFRPVRVLPRYYAAEGDGVLMRCEL